MVSPNTPTPAQMTAVSSIRASYSPQQKTLHKTGVIGDGPEIASRAGVQMAPERSRSTCGDGPQHAELLIAKPGVILFSEAVALDAKDIGHFYQRPSHLSFFR
jgi:hypothetical protein